MTFLKDCAATVHSLATFAQRARAREGKVINQLPMAELASRMQVEHWLAQGGLTGEALAGFLDTYLAVATRLHDPRCMAHQVAVPEPMGALGMLVEAFINNSGSLYEMGPSATVVEYQMLNWMLAKAGWTPAPLPGQPSTGSFGGGVFTHGGSLANLTALMAARGAAAPEAWKTGVPGNLVLVAPEICHYSIGRAADILGLGRDRLLAPPVDGDGRIRPEALPGFLQQLQEGGARILAVVANACSTPAGLFDPIRPVAEACRAAGIWLHVDGTHGGSALLSPRLRGLLDGLELADSLAWDTHKMMRAPMVSAAVLVREHQHLDQAFHQEASYMFHDKDQPGVDLIHRHLECSMGVLGLRGFMALAAEGEQAMARYVERQVDLARAAADLIKGEPGFELAVTPDFNIVCFRVEGTDQLQLDLRKHLLNEGEFYITTTDFRGRRWLRLSLMNPATELEDIRALIGRIKAIQPIEGVSHEPARS